MSKWNRRELLGAAGSLALPLPPLAAQNSPQFPAPDLANLHEFADWISRENQPRLSFLDAKWKSLESWKQVARPLFRRQLSYDPKPVPLSAEVVGREERDGFTIERVKIRATTAYDIPARVLIPAGQKGRAPGVVAIHCHSGRYGGDTRRSSATPTTHRRCLSFAIAPTDGLTRSCWRARGTS